MSRAHEEAQVPARAFSNLCGRTAAHAALVDEKGSARARLGESQQALAVVLAREDRAFHVPFKPVSVLHLQKALNKCATLRPSGAQRSEVLGFEQCQYIAERVFCHGVQS